MDSSGQIPIEGLLELVRDARTVNWNGAAATTCLVFDILITLDQEVEHIWKRQWTIPKFLFLFARYFTLIVQLFVDSIYSVITQTYLIALAFFSLSVSIHTNQLVLRSQTHCQKWTIFEGVSGQLIVMGVEISLMLRVYALFKRDKWILVFLIALYLAEVTANSTIIGLGLTQIVSVAPLRGIFPADFPLSGCFPTFVPKFFYSYWIPTLIFESALFIMMAINFVRVVRIQKLDVPILTLFFRDGTAFYAVIFVTLLTQVLLYQLVNSALAQVAIGWQLTVFSIANSRLILHLRSSPISRIPNGTRTRSGDPWSNTGDTNIGHELTKIEFGSGAWRSRNGDGVNDQLVTMTSGTAIERTIDESRRDDCRGISEEGERCWISNRGDWLEDWERV